MNPLRRMSTRRLLVLLVSVAALIAAAAIGAVAALGGSSATPPAKPLAQAIHDALAAPAPSGITARITFTNHLFPSGSLPGVSGGSALLSGASGRLWLTGDGRLRLELQSDGGDTQIVSDGKVVTVYDGSSNTVYKATLPARKPQTEHSPPSVSDVQSELDKLASDLDLSGATPDSVAGQPAYTVRVAPKQNGGLVGALELSWDATQGVPLRAALFAVGSTSPVLELKATDISYGPVSSADVSISPPAGAHVVDLGTLSAPAPKSGGASPLPFTPVAPDSLAGFARTGMRQHGDSEIVRYGKGLSGVVVIERKAGAKSPLDSLPNRELQTPLGTAIARSSGGISYVVAGSEPAATVEAAARALP